MDSIDTVTRAPVNRAGVLGKLIRSCLYHTGIALYHCGLAGCIISMSPQRVRTLLYHSVDANPGSYTANLNVNVTPEVFERHLAYFRTYYRVGSTTGDSPGHRNNCTLAITFDDGYASVEHNAVPLLERYGMPATVYLIGKAVQGGMVWVNRLNHLLNTQPQRVANVLASYPTLSTLTGPSVIKRVQKDFSPAEVEHLMAQLAAEFPESDTAENLFSGPEDIMAMQARGISFGFHTNNHYNLERCDDATLDEELDSSAVSHLLNSRSFAYPFGYFDSRSTQRLEQQGYKQLLTVARAPLESNALHQERSETFETSAAGVFAQLEVVEPVIALLRKLVFICRQPIRFGLDHHGTPPFTADFTDSLHRQKRTP